MRVYYKEIFMAIFDLFSKRQKRLKGELPEIYQFDDIPHPLRIQIVKIIDDAIGMESYSSTTNEDYKFIHDALCREYGLFDLHHSRTFKESVFNFFLEINAIEKAIDVIELSMKYIDKIVRNRGLFAGTDRKLNADEAIEELNERFKEAGVGYQFEAGEIVKMDSSFIHSEIVKPTISLLWNKTFHGANDEYMKAHEHYRHGRNKEAIAECLKAFESTIKIICKEKGWVFQESDTSKTLILICFNNGLIPSYLQSQFTSLRNLLESGIPTIRNKVGSHGQGQNKVTAEDNLVRYALNLTSSNIIFLVELSGIK